MNALAHIGTLAQRAQWALAAAAKCGQCGRFKSRPSATCDYCGDDPVRYGQCPHEYDREHGWDWS